MNVWFDLREKEQGDILQQVSASTGWPVAAVEKDLWVSFMLEALFRTTVGAHAIFKGGTSLSKGWRLIERFSEDVDVGVSRDFFGFAEDISQADVKRLRKASCRYFSQDLPLQLEAQLDALGCQHYRLQLGPMDGSDADPVKIELWFKGLVQPSSYLRPMVLLEIGSRSMREPMELCPITSIVQETLGAALGMSHRFEVATVMPHRTLLEKIFLLHEEFQKPAGKPIRTERMSRHLYDIWKLSHSPWCLKALGEEGLFAAITRHRQRYTRLGYVDYSLHTHRDVVFVPPTGVMKEYQQDYERMRQEMIFGESPSYPELISFLSALNAKFNAKDQAA